MPGTSGIKDIPFGGGLFVAITGNLTVLTSTDGNSWIKNDSCIKKAGWANGYINRIAYGKELYIAVEQPDFQANQIIISKQNNTSIVFFSNLSPLQSPIVNNNHKESYLFNLLGQISYVNYCKQSDCHLLSISSNAGPIIILSLQVYAGGINGFYAVGSAHLRRTVPEMIFNEPVK